jgi:hypothetical protein
MGMMLWILIIVALCPLISYGVEWLFRRRPASSPQGSSPFAPGAKR